MKILIVSAQFPYPTWSGFTTRVYQLARRLSARHEVTLLSYVFDHERAGIAELAAQLPVRTVPHREAVGVTRRPGQLISMASTRPYCCHEVHSREMQRAIDELCTAERFDIVQLESSLLGVFDLPPHVRVVIDEHNIESEVFRRMSDSERSPARRAFNRLEHLRYRRHERACWQRADACVTTSERELPTIAAAAPDTPLAAVPNAVDLDYFTPAEDPPQPLTVIFNGILTYRPNVDAARHLIDDVWPRVRARHPNARLALVGRSTGVDPRTLAGPGVTVVGAVPDLRPHLAGAAVVAVPVRFGGGTRLKVLEGLAMGKAIVSTSLGCEGLAVRDGEHLIVADDAEAFATRICDLFDDPWRAARLGRAGRALVAEHYSWELAGERLEALYREIHPDAAVAPAPAVVQD